MGQSLSNPDRRVISGSKLDTLRLRSQITDEELYETFGSSLFRSQNQLMLTIQGADQPLIFDPAPVVFLGRFETRSFNSLNIDLTPYQAREKGVSRLHAVVHRTQFSLFIEDAKSANGTYLNGKRLPPNQRHLLRDNDQIRLGTVVINVSYL